MSMYQFPGDEEEREEVCPSCKRTVLVTLHFELYGECATCTWLGPEYANGEED